MFEMFGPKKDLASFVNTIARDQVMYAKQIEKLSAGYTIPWTELSETHKIAALKNVLEFNANAGALENLGFMDVSRAFNRVYLDNVTWQQQTMNSVNELFNADAMLDQYAEEITKSEDELQEKFNKIRASDEATLKNNDNKEAVGNA